MNRGPCVWVLSAIVMLASVSSGRAADDQSAEATVRALVRANAEKDMETMSRLIAHDADITSYTMGGENTSAGATLNGTWRRSSNQRQPSKSQSGNSKCGREAI